MIAYSLVVRQQNMTIGVDGDGLLYGCEMRGFCDGPVMAKLVVLMYNWSVRRRREWWRE